MFRIYHDYLHFNFLKPLAIGGLLILASCQSFSDKNFECVQGFVKTSSGCHLINSESTSSEDSSNSDSTNSMYASSQVISKLQSANSSLQKSPVGYSSVSAGNGQAPVKYLSEQTAAASNTTSSMPRSSMNNSIFKSDIGFKDSTGYNNTSR